MKPCIYYIFLTVFLIEFQVFLMSGLYYSVVQKDLYIHFIIVVILYQI